jgi:uncharacterized alkaline shock family protein YloU
MNTTNDQYAGTIVISERAIAVIAAQIAVTVESVVSLAASMAEGVAAKLGRKNLAAGVTAHLEGHVAEVTIRLIVRYGYRIPDVALQVQKIVKDTVEQMTGYSVAAVHIVVQGIDFTQTSAAMEMGDNHDR